MFTGEIDAAILRELEIKRSCKEQDKRIAPGRSWILLWFSRLSILSENFLGVSQYSKISDEDGTEYSMHGGTGIAYNP
jgi:hypothetical protein